MKTKFFYGMAALATLGLTACSSEEPANNGNGVSDKDQSLYLKVAIQDVNNGTRTEDKDFLKGEPAENAIKSLQFKFYDASGKQMCQTSVAPAEGNDEITFDPTDQAGNVNKLRVATIRVDVNQGDNMPAYVVCFANPVIWTSAEDETAGDNISQMQGLRDVTRSNYLGTNGSFAMNNSVYYGNDPISGTNDVKMVGAPIQKGQLFTSEEAAKAATDAKNEIVNIYIERYASRIDVTIAENAVTAATFGGYTLTFNPEAVGITADAPTMYAVKRFANTNAADDAIPTMAEVQANFPGWTLWNEPAKHRSYWACSPSYYATEFPTVSDDIIDKAVGGTTGAGEIVEGFALKYYSYNQMTAANSVYASTIAADGNKVTRYALENTMGAKAFASRNPKAAAPSVLLVGNTTLKVGDAEIAAGTTFYIWNDGIYFDGTVPANAATGAQTIQAAMLNVAEGILAADDKGTKLTAVPEGVTMTVTHPSLAARNTTGVKLSEELVTLQVQNPGTGLLYYKPTGSDTWTALNTGNTDAINYVNRQLAGKLNYANAYTQGKCYYTIPIQHLGLDENTSASPIVNGVLDWTKVRVGDFGLVRNHVYTININEINGYGSGIFNPANPIVTPMNTYSYWIKYSLNVLNWRIVKTQGVILD